MNLPSALFLSLSRAKAFLAFFSAFFIVEVFFYNALGNVVNLFNILFWILALVYILIIDYTSNKQDIGVYLSRSFQGLMQFLALSCILLFITDSTELSFTICVVLLYGGLDFVLFLLLRIGFSFFPVYKIASNRLVIVGRSADRKRMVDYIQSNVFLVTKVVHELESENLRIEDSISKLRDFLSENDADEILILDGSLERESVRLFLKLADKFGTRLKFSLEPNWIESQLENNYSIAKIGELPILNLRSIPLDRFKNRVLKRAFDLILGFIFLSISLPLFVLIAIAIKIDSRGPVFYIPRRIGLNKTEFNCFKFRTMRVNNLDQSAVKDDPRITRLGRFLRRTSLDEIPQLINILLGNMSLVGPRPHRISLNKEFQEHLGGYMVRHYVKPGLTGWAQVNNFRGPAVSEYQKVGRRNCDIWYIANWTFWLDLKIVTLTFFRMGNQSNAF